MRKSSAILVAAAITAGIAGCGDQPGAPVASVTISTTVAEPPGTGIPGTEADAYIAAMAPALNAVGTALAGIPAECGPSNTQECREALKKVHGANAELEKQLAGRTAPGCLHDADAEMRSSTGLMDQAMHDGMRGIEDQDHPALQRMGRELDQSSAHQTRALDLLQHSSC